MTWGMVAGAAITVVGGVISSKKANKQSAAQYTDQLADTKIAWDQNTAENKAIGEANLTNTIRTGYKVGLLNVQQAQSKKLALEKGFDTSVQGKQALGATTANAAASGTIGNSVDAVVSDIQSKIGEANIQQISDFAVETQNFETMLHDILTQGQDSLQSGHNIHVRSPKAPQLIGTGDILAGAVLKAGSKYASDYMSLGLGSTSRPVRMKTFNVSPGTASINNLGSTDFLNGLISS